MVGILSSLNSDTSTMIVIKAHKFKLKTPQAAENLLIVKSSKKLLKFLKVLLQNLL